MFKHGRGGLPIRRGGLFAVGLLLLCFTLAITIGNVFAQPVPSGQVELEGTVEVLHEDRDVGSRYLYFLQTATERLEVIFADEAPALTTGDHVRVRGLRANGLLAAGSGSSVQTLSTALPNTFGGQETLVILVNFVDKATEPYTAASARSVAKTKSNFDLENSFQQTELTAIVDTGEAADVHGWYTIQQSSSVCDYNKIASLAEQAAAADGVNVSAYPRRVYAFPSISACNWWGLGTVGGNPSRAWINGSFTLKVVGHEMGHNFGLYHSRALECGSTVLGASCSSIEYGDTLDIMGNPSSGHFNAFQKERLGWLDYNISPPIVNVTADGVYWIAPYESQDLDPKALKILKSTDPSTGKSTYYYVEHRTATGFDSFVSSNGNVLSGVVIHTGSESSANSSYLLDMTPATSSWNDPALVAGQIFSDPDAGVTITTLSADSTGASVSVTFGSGGGSGGPTTCIRANPTVTISPSSQWVIGLTASYTVTVANNDNSACTASSFNLSGALPSGWTASFGSMGPVAPGSSGSASLAVVAPTETPDGFYSITVTATNSANITYSGSVSAVEACCSGTLAVKVTTDKATYTKNSWVTITVNVRVGQTAVAGASVTLTVGPAGTNGSTMTGSTDANGNAVVKFRVGPRDATGTYQAMATATSSGWSGSDNTGTFKVVAR